MLSVAHTLASLPFGIYLDQPLLIFIAAFIWHLFCDTLPHWNIYPDQFAKYPYHLVAVDVLGGLIIAWLLLGDRALTIPILAAIAGGNAPDIIHGLWDFVPATVKQHLSWLQPWFHWHDRLQVETNHIPAGLVSQIAVVVLALVLI